MGTRIRITELHPRDAFYDVRNIIIGAEGERLSLHESAVGKGFYAGMTTLNINGIIKDMYFYGFKFEEIEKCKEKN